MLQHKYVCNLFTVMQIVVMLSAIVLSVVMLSAIVLTAIQLPVAMLIFTSPSFIMLSVFVLFCYAECR
jgi:hypothetical protein